MSEETEQDLALADRVELDELLRRPVRKIGGTDIPMLLGLSKYGGPKEVFERLVLGKELPWNPKMGRGNREEPRVRRLFVERFGAELAPRPEKFILQHPRHEFATVSPDDFGSLFGVDGTIDYKSVVQWALRSEKPGEVWGPEFSDIVPFHIACQLHWAMEVGDKDTAFVFAAFGEDLDNDTRFDISETRLYRLERDREMAAWMLEVAERFYRDHVLTGVVPENPKKGRAA